MRLVAIALALAALALGDDTAGKFKLIQTTLVLPAGAGSQTFIVLVKGAGLKVDTKHPVSPSLADANTPASVADLGDSGSLVVEKTSRKAVGLLHAADDLGSFYFAHPIEDVLNELEIELELG